MNKPPKIVIAPINRGNYITEGKEYEVIESDSHDDVYGYKFNIIDNTGFNLVCLENKCEQILKGNWIIKERQS